MKVLTYVVMMVAIVAFAFVGCNRGGSAPTTQPTVTDNLAQTLDDITFASKSATVLALNQYKVPADKVCDVEEYVDAVRMLIETPNDPDFDGARRLVSAKLPQQTRAVGLTVVDLVERYASPRLPQVQGKAAQRQQMAAAVLAGVAKGINEYQMTLPPTATTTN